MYRDQFGEFVCGYWGLKGQKQTEEKELQKKTKQKKSSLAFNLKYCNNCFFAKYRKIPKISPSKYKPPNPVTQKTVR